MCTTGPNSPCTSPFLRIKAIETRSDIFRVKSVSFQMMLKKMFPTVAIVVVICFHCQKDSGRFKKKTLLLKSQCIINKMQ